MGVVRVRAVGVVAIVVLVSGRCMIVMEAGIVMAVRRRIIAAAVIIVVVGVV